MLGPIEVRVHERALYVRSGLDECLLSMTIVNGIQYALYEDIVYNVRSFLETSFQKSSLSDAEKAFNKDIWKLWVPMEFF